jgi:Zn-dependent peptidase ImmA (M78 family)
MNEPRKNRRTPDISLATRKADEVLSRAGYLRPPVPIHDILLDYGLQVHTQALEANVSGFLVRKDTGAFVGVNALHHRNRQRFTLAHELGHFVLHKDEPTVFVDDALIHFRGENVTQPSDIFEMEANAFAGALLMPEKMLRQDLAGRYIDALDESAVRTLARRYEVSPQALTLRLMRIGLLGGVAPPGGKAVR